MATATYQLAPVPIQGAPVAGTDEVQTLTIAGGPPATLTFVLSFKGFSTSVIAWSNVNATLLASINTALQALASVGPNGIVATAGTLTAGIGTILLTCSGAPLAKRAQSLIGVSIVTRTGTVTTMAIAETTPGVDATGMSMAIMPLLVVNVATGEVYRNSGTPLSPVWTLTA